MEQIDRDFGGSAYGLGRTYLVIGATGFLGVSSSAVSVERQGSRRALAAGNIADRHPRLYRICGYRKLSAGRETPGWATPEIVLILENASDLGLESGLSQGRPVKAVSGQDAEQIS